MRNAHMQRDNPCATVVVQTRSTLCVTCRFVVAAERLGVRAVRVLHSFVAVCGVPQLCRGVPWRGIVRLCRGVCACACVCVCMCVGMGLLVVVRVCVHCNGTLEYMTMRSRLYGCYIVLCVC